ncbi:N-acetylglucosaminyl-phosphatidylinositol de-N-acetylase [Lipomyces kononenkoae]|uniref:N-acetylglucosaminyl-phosphatidylinositol de-N-acetylase n=1 Tax=Lipomyces kononenkoae TaxID=34357 RepID=A0ACC3T0B9_LIPKO
MLQKTAHTILGWLSTRGRRRWVVRVGLALLLFPVFLQWALAYLLGSDARILPQELQYAKNLLIVTAHPDDECLFFAPSILGVLDRNRQMTGGLLVMSTGNNYGLGETRKQELLGSCKALGIDQSRCVALDHPQLQDDPKVWWETSVIQPIVEDYVRKWDIDAIITFDSGGVSGHINHRAVSAAISTYVAGNDKAPPSYMVVTRPLIRKYTFLFDLPLTALPFTWRIITAIFVPSQHADPSYSSKALAVNTWHRYIRTRAAFRSHDSQYSWDRHLYMVLSRYVWFNDLTRATGR